VTCDFENAPLEQVLQQLIGPTKLGYRVEAGMVILGGDVPAPEGQPTTPAPAGEAWQVRVYDVSDLVTKDATTGRPDFSPLVTRLRAGVLPKSWDTPGGEATIRGFDSTVSLVIRQTAAGHEAIAKSLDELRTKRP
jgi:hypothetical protein